MRAAVITQVEKTVDRTASALFAGACGYAAFTWLGQRTGMPVLGVEAAAAMLLAYLLSIRTLGSVQPAERKAPLSVFDLRSLEAMEGADELLLIEAHEPMELPTESDELLLTEQEQLPDNPFERAERLLLEHYKAAPDLPEVDEDHEEPLLLDDILAELEPDSRVVRLFDPEAMPTPGQLQARIDRHLEPGESGHDSPDAGQALHDALAELRRSIR